MKQQKMLNKNKGITLIALVITIIVMLILVAVTISMAVNGGLFEYAGRAVGEMQNAMDVEKELANGRIQIGGKWYDSIDDYLTGEPSTGFKIKLSINGTKITTVPVPTGFTHTEGTIDTGYVIQDGDGNEFVWVPVDKNQKITLSVESEKDIQGLFLLDPYGDEILVIEDGDIETTYSNTEITPTINGLYTAIILTDEGMVEERLTVRSLYAKDAWNDWYISEEYAIEMAKGFSSIYGVEIEQSKEGYWEWYAANLLGIPDLATILQEEGITLDLFITLMMAEASTSLKNYEDIVDYSESVNTNGGFYIARYEAGATTARTNGNADDTVETIKTANGRSVSKEGYVPYNNITYSQAKGLAESMYEENENYEVSLLTGSAWDRTLGWINEKGSKSIKEIVIDSRDWGNYCFVTFDITKGKYSEDYGESYISVSGTYTKTGNDKVLLTTGATTRNSANNIFDLAGNVEEWTNEVFSSGQIACRGGDFEFKGDAHPASDVKGSPVRACNPCVLNEYNDALGFRPALYLK